MITLALTLSIAGLVIIIAIALEIYTQHLTPVQVRQVDGYLMIPLHKIKFKRAAQVTPAGGLLFHNGHPGATVQGVSMGGEVHTLPVYELEGVGRMQGTLLFYGG